MIQLKTQLSTNTGNHEVQVLLNTSWLAVLDESAGHVDRLACRIDRLSRGGPSKSVIVVASVRVARVPLQQNGISPWSHTHTHANTPIQAMDSGLHSPGILAASVALRDTRQPRR